MKGLVLAAVAAFWLALLPFGAVVADDSSLEGEAIVLIGVEVDTAISTSGYVSSEATAVDSEGHVVPVTGGTFSLDISDWEGTVTLPVALSEGETLASFTDPDGGLSLTEGKLTISLKDAAGDEVMTVTADVATVKGAGDSTEVVATNVVLASKELSVDFTSVDEDVSTVTASFEVDLKSLPEGASVDTSITEEPDEEAHSAFQLIAKGEDAVIADIAYTLNIKKTNLENEANLGEGTITMKVGRDWAERYGVDKVMIMRRTDEGDTEMLPTTFVGFEDGQAVFQAVSPGGLSVFALTALVPLSAASAILIPVLGAVFGGGGTIGFLAFLILRRRRAREIALMDRWPTGLRPEDWK